MGSDIANCVLVPLHGFSWVFGRGDGQGLLNRAPLVQRPDDRVIVQDLFRGAFPDNFVRALQIFFQKPVHNFNSLIELSTRLATRPGAHQSKPAEYDQPALEWTSRDFV